MPRHGFQLAEEYDPRWHPANAIAEFKQDGFMVLVEDGRLWVRGREGEEPRDETCRFPELHLPTNAVLVGELVVLKNGISQFSLLLRRKVENPMEILLRSKLYPATLIGFDVLEVDGRDLQREPLSARRPVLEGLTLDDSVRVADYWGCPPEKVEADLSVVRAMHGEGLMVKNLDAMYAPRRGYAWLKVKAWETETFEVQRHQVTENHGFVVYIVHKGYEQKVVVNDRELQASVAAGRAKRLRIRYLPTPKDEDNGALRQPHVVGVAWDR